MDEKTPIPPPSDYSDTDETMLSTVRGGLGGYMSAQPKPGHFTDLTNHGHTHNHDAQVECYKPEPQHFPAADQVGPKLKARSPGKLLLAVTIIIWLVALGLYCWAIATGKAS
jgi:hypothetical protein